VAAIGGQIPFLFPLLSPVRKLKEIPAPEAPLVEELAVADDGALTEPGHLPHVGTIATAPDGDDRIGEAQTGNVKRQ
jgi:hypothetical protein